MKRHVWIGLLFAFCFCLLSLTGCELPCADGHTPVEDAAVAATCTETGLSAGSHCSVCGMTLTKQDIQVALGHTKSDWIVDKEATHSLPGSKHTECVVCDAVLETMLIPAEGHTFSEWEDTVAGDCTTPATQTRVCACGESEVRQGAAAGHVESDWVDDVLATHTVSGSRYVYCTVCEAVLRTEIVNATGHRFSAWKVTVQPTCGAEGLETRNCTCGEREERPVAALGHTLGEWSVITDPTCTQLGIEERTCTRAGCETSEIRQIAATGHQPSEWIEDVAATHTTSGSKHIECTVPGCKATLAVELISAQGHTFAAWETVSAATCEMVGIQSRSCSCGESESKYIPALGHDMGAWEITQDPTCLNAGVEKRACTHAGCEMSESKLVPAVGHAPSEWIEDTAATHVSSGTKHVECTVCQEVLKSELINAAGHSFGTWEITQAATCTKGGVQVRTCACGASESKQIPATGHTESAWIEDKAVTHVSSGSRYIKCTVCEETLKTEFINAQGHTFSQWETVVPATCTALGTQVRTCACGASETQYIAATGHGFGDWIIISEATCTQLGVERRSCQCGECETRQLPAQGHVESAWITNDPTHTAHGMKYVECTVCGTVLKKEVLDILGHEFTAWQTEVAPTCTAAGIESRRCECGEIETQYVPAPGHSFGTWQKESDATCAQMGIERRTCTHSGCTESETRLIAAKGHTESAWIVDEDATHTTPGTKHVACTTCGVTLKSVVIEAVGHSFSAWEIRAATCTDAGEQTRSCDCGAKEIVHIPALGHSLGEWIVVTAADCERTGVEERACTRNGCDTKESRLIVATGHTEGEWITDVAATHSEFGSMRMECSVCEKTISRQIIPVLPHVYGEWTVVLLPTCEGGGINARYCECGSMDLDVVPALGHSYGEWVLTDIGNCTEKGEETRSCACGKFETRETNSFGPHIYGEWVQTVAPTCVTAGKEQQICTCGATQERDVPATGVHVYGAWVQTIAPTCVTVGKEQQICTCGAMQKRDVPATGVHIYGAWVQTVAPTDTTKGEEKRVCDCGAFETQEIPMLGHSFGAWVQTIAPGCETKGEEKRTCSCGEVETREIPATGHSYGAWMQTLAPTCVNEGEEKRTCACGAYETNAIPATGVHHYGEWVQTVAPTCVTAGKEQQICACGATQERDVPATGVHHYGVWMQTLAPTCVNEGEEQRTCACGDVETREIPATGIHHYGAWVQTVAPTDTTKGEEKRVCDCGAFETQEIPMLGHSFSAWVQTVAPGCATKGEEKRTCSCGEVETREIPATGLHTFGAWTEVIAPGCETKGEEKRTCACGAYETQEIPAAGHTFGTWIVVLAPGCETKGEERRTCACGAYETNVIPATGIHTFGAWQESTPATCAKNGVAKRTCTCGAYETTDIPALPHTFGAWTEILAPGCETKGEEKRTCTCGAYETREIPAAGHTFGSWIVVLTPGCDTKGEERRTCACGAYETNVIPATGIHAFGAWQVSTPATCTENGVATRLCKCGANEERDLVALGHSYGEWIQLRQPTCVDDGKEQRVCQECGAVETMILPAKGHSFDAWTQTVAPTCTVNGEEKRSCACGALETRVIVATGHSFGAWTQTVAPTCTVNGEEKRSCACGALETRVIVATGTHIADSQWTVTLMPTVTAAGTSNKLCQVCGTTVESAANSMNYDGSVVVKKTTSVSLGSYAVIYKSPTSATSEFSAHLDRLCTAMKGATGSTFTARTDATSATSREILIGLTNRAESQQAYATLSGNAFTVRVVGNKIVILGTNDMLTMAALQYFINYYLGGSSTVTMSVDVTANDLAANTLVGSNSSNFIYVLDHDLDRDPLHMYVADSYGNKGYTGDGRDYPVYLLEELISKLSVRTGLGVADFTTTTDVDKTYESGYELLFGDVERVESRAFRGIMAANEYGYAIWGKKVIITAHTDAGLEKAMNEFIAFYDVLLANNGGVLPQGYAYIGAVTDQGWIVDFPQPDGVAIRMAQNNNDKSIQIIYTGDKATANGFLAYCSKLESAGYTIVQKSDNMGNTGSYFRLYKNTATSHVLYVAYNAFAAQGDYADTFMNEETAGTQFGDFIHYSVVNTGYPATLYPMRNYEECIRVVSAPLSTAYLPDAKLLTQQSYTKICATSITTVRYVGSSVGMCYVLQLEDGSFFIVDGGNYVTANYDREILFHTLSELHKRATGSAPSTSNPIHITAWMVTHSHGDHYSNMNAFLKEYAPKKLVKMDYLVGNYPEISTVYSVTSGSDNINMGTTYIPNMQKYFTDAGLTAFKFVKAHTGMTLYFANLKLEVLMTTEDHAPFRITNSNDTNTVTKWTIRATSAASGSISAATVNSAKGTTWTMLGDSCIYASRWLCAMWGGKYNPTTQLYDGGYMKADMVQLAHHGNIGCEVALYKTVQPTVVWFPHNASSYNSYTQNGKTNWTRHVDNTAINLPSVKYIIVSGIAGDSYTDSVTVSFNANGLYLPNSNPGWGIKFNKSAGTYTTVNLAFDTSSTGKVTSSPIVRKSSSYYGNVGGTINAATGVAPSTHTHTGTWNITLAPTCTATGMQQLTCTICNEVIKEVLPMIGHTLDSWVVVLDPTQTSDGYKTQSCTVCHNVINTEILPSLPTSTQLAYVLSGGKITITGYHAIGSKTLSIPASIAGYPVTKIATGAFRNATYFTSITLPSSIQEIEAGAFEGCSVLTKASGLITLGDWLISVTADSNTVTIPATVKKIANDAFVGCYKLVRITNLSGLALKGLPANVGQEIRTSTSTSFKNTLSTTSGITIYTVGSVKYLFAYTGSSTTLDLTGKGVTAIYAHALAGNTTVKTLTIPESITDIGVNAFAGCQIETLSATIDATLHVPTTHLKSLTVTGTPADIPSNFLNGCSTVETLVFPSTILITRKGALSGCVNVTSLTGPANMMSQEAGAYFSKLVSVHINGGTSIPKFAFYKHPTLKHVTIAPSVTTIAAQAFMNCYELETFVFDDIENSKLTSLGDYQFCSNAKMTSLVLPEGITTLPAQFLVGCTGITQFTIPSTVTKIRYEAFSKTGLTSIVIPANVTTMEDRTDSAARGIFSECTKLTSVTFASGSKLTHIANYAFYKCTSLTSITIPASVTSIGKGAFQGSALTSASFATTSGWWRTTSSTATSGTAVTVSSASTAATYLKSTYASNYWKRS